MFDFQNILKRLEEIKKRLDEKYENSSDNDLSDSEAETSTSTSTTTSQNRDGSSWV